MAQRKGGGALDRRMAFDCRVAASDGMGNVVGAFAEQFTRAVCVTPLRSGETVMAARLEGKQPVSMLVRACAKTKLVSNDWRVRDVRNGAVYAVTSLPLLSDDGQFISFLAQTGGADG